MRLNFVLYAWKISLSYKENADIYLYCLICFMLVRRHLCSEDGNNLHKMFVYSLQIGEREFNKKRNLIIRVFYICTCSPLKLCQP